LVHITPAERPGVPTTSPAIMNRMQEIIREMRMIASYNKLIEQGRMGGGKCMLMHAIGSGGIYKGIFVVKQTERRLGFPAAPLQHGARPGRPMD
jgi:hypothetical protein